MVNLDWTVRQVGFDGCSLATPRQLGIAGVIRDYQGTVTKAYPKPTGESFCYWDQSFEVVQSYSQGRFWCYHFMGD